MPDNPIPAPVRPANCGECARYIRDPDNPGHGWCDNWAGFFLSDDAVWHPNFGIKRKGTAK